MAEWLTARQEIPMTSTTIKPSTSRKVKCLIRNSEPTQPQTMTRPTPKLTYGPPYFSNKFIGRILSSVDPFTWGSYRLCRHKAFDE